MHLYAFVQAAEIWVKTESHWIPAHELTLWQQPKKASVGRWSRATSEFPHRIVVRRRDLSNSLKAELLGYFALCGAQ